MHPFPAPPKTLRSLFPAHSLTYTSSIIPSRNGETLPQVHDRCAYALSCIISSLDREVGDEDVAIVICTHAASLIAMGRALTGVMPRDANEEDFKPFTCGVSKFVRRRVEREMERWEKGTEVPELGWRGKGVGGGWICVMNGSCEHLSGGAERGW
jgi:transcription factor C subunit 7